MALTRSEYEIGLRIKARDRTGKWYLASILEVDEVDRDLLVHFEGWNQRHDEWIDFGSDRLRPLTPTTAQQFSTSKWEPKVGEEVKARWMDKRLYIAKIMRITSEGQYKVKFRDGLELTLAYDDMRSTRKSSNVPANRLREPLELAEGGSTGVREGEGSKEGASVKGKGAETKSHSQSEKFKLDEKAKKPPTSPEGSKEANSGGVTSPQRATRSGQTKKSEDSEDTPPGERVTRRSNDRPKRSNTKTEQTEKRNTSPEDSSSASSRQRRVTSPPSSGAAQKQQQSTSPKQQASSRSQRSSKERSSASSTEPRPVKDRSSGREKRVSSPKEASPKDRSSSKSRQSAQEKEPSKDDGRREKEGTTRTESKSHRRSKERESGSSPAKSRSGKERDPVGTTFSSSKSRSGGRDEEGAATRSDKSEEEGQSTSSRSRSHHSSRERESRSHHRDGERPTSRKRRHPSGSSDSSSSKVRKKNEEPGGPPTPSSTPQRDKEKTEDLSQGSGSSVQQSGRRREGRKQPEEQREKTRKKAQKDKGEDSTENSKTPPTAPETPRAISVSVIRTCSTATSSDSEPERRKPHKSSGKIAAVGEDRGRAPSLTPLQKEGGADLPSRTSSQDVTIVSISSSRRKAYTPQHVSSLPSSPTKGGFPQISPIHATPGYTPSVLFQASGGDVTQSSDKGVSLSTTRKLHLTASPMSSDSEAPLDGKEAKIVSSEKRPSMSAIAEEEREEPLLKEEQNAPQVKEVRSPSSKRELSSSGYNVAILNEDSPTQSPDDPAVIIIEPVRVAPDKYTRQQSKGCTEKSSLSEDVETAFKEGEQKMSAIPEGGGGESAGSRTSVSGEDASESDTSVEVKRLKSCSLVLGQPPASRLRSQSMSSLPVAGERRSRSRRVQKSRDEGNRIAIQNIQRFKRMTGLDVPDVAGVGKRIGKSPKEVVINIDHNAYKCKHAGCNKSFRKEPLLLWHIKHYHPGIKLGKKTPGVVPKPRPPGVRSPPHGIVKKLAISRVRKTQQQGGKGEPLRAAALSGTAATASTMELKKESEETRPTPIWPVGEERREGGVIGKSYASLPAIPATTFPANITPHKPPLGRPPKRPTAESNRPGSHIQPVAMETTPASKRPRFSQPVERETPKTAKPQGVRRRAAASARQHRLKDFSDSEGASEEDSMDSLDASWRSGSSDSLSLISLDAGQDVHFVDEDEGVELARQGSLPGQPSGRGRVYNRYCSGHKDDVIHCVCASFKEEGFMIQCDQCLSWQHGECVDVDEQNPPQDYICFACIHPRALRKSAKYRLDRMWFGRGKLLSHPEEPPFPHSAAVLRSHRLAQELMRLSDVHHSVRLLLNLASDPTNPQLKHWSPSGNEDTIQYLKGVLVNALMNANPSLGNDIHEDATHLGNTGHRTAASTSAKELGGLTNRLCSPVNQSERSESHADDMDTGELPSGIKHADDDAVTTQPPPDDCDTDIDVTYVSHGDLTVLSPPGDASGSFQSLPLLTPCHMPSDQVLPPASALPTLTGSDVSRAVDLLSSIPLLPLPQKEDSSESVPSLSEIVGVTSFGEDYPGEDSLLAMSRVLLGEVERGEPASVEALCKAPSSGDMDQLRATLAAAAEEEGDASMDSELQGEGAVVADPPAQLLGEGVVYCPIPLRSLINPAVSPLGATVGVSSSQQGQPKASILSLGLSDHSPFKVVQQQQQVSSPQPDREELSSPASPEFNTFSFLADLDDRQNTVPMSSFAESYVRSDPDDWCARMVLIDRIAALQDVIVQRMAVIEKEIEALPEADPVISANGKSGPKKNIFRKTIQELRHSIPMEQPKLSI